MLCLCECLWYKAVSGIYIYKFINSYICIRAACIHACIHTNQHIYKQTYMYVQKYTKIHACVHKSIQKSIQTNIYTYKSTCTYKVYSHTNSICMFCISNLQIHKNIGALHNVYA